MYPVITKNRKSIYFLMTPTSFHKYQNGKIVKTYGNTRTNRKRFMGIMEVLANFGEVYLRPNPEGITFAFPRSVQVNWW